MVKRLLLACFILLAAPNIAIAAAQLALVLDKSEVQIGKHIKAKLYGIDLTANLSDISINSLSEDFSVVILESSDDDADDYIRRHWSNQHVQSLQFALYPRQTGALSIPALTIAGVHSQAQIIQVTESIKQSRHGDTPIKRDLFVSTSQPWERQQVRVELKISSADTFISLRSETPHIAGFEVYSLPSRSEKTLRDGIKYTTISAGWVLFPLSAGTHTIDLPAIEYRKSGRTLRTFYLPKQTFSVQALPSYIPPTMPVGKVAIDTSLITSTEANLALFPDTLYYWNISLTGTGMSSRWLPPVLRQIRPNNTVNFLPKESEQNQTFNQSGLQSQVVHHIPLKAKGSGRLTLPVLRIQFFEPDTGKIETLIHQPEKPFVLSSVWRSLITGSLFLLLLRTAYLLYKKIKDITQRRKLRNSAFRMINSAGSTADIRQALKILSQSEGWPTNVTLSEWALHWKKQHRVDSQFDTTLDQLSHACYKKNSPVNIDALRLAIFQQLSNKIIITTKNAS